MPLLALSIGCPSGIGPEVSLAAVASLPEDIRVVLYGDAGVLRERAAAVSVDADRIYEIDHIIDLERLPHAAIPVIAPFRALTPAERLEGKPSEAGGAAQLSWIDAATDAVSSGVADALVTGPVSKKAIASSGAPNSADFLGHTEHLGRRLQAEEVVMAFVADALTVTLVTTHLPLRRVADAITAASVATAAYWTARLVDDLDAPADLPVGVLSLNPHAGEGGLLGDEEREVIAPGIERARERLAADGRRRALVGPLPAESALRQAVRNKRYAACVAMYHDQATIPSKIVAFGDAVNVTLGLPIVRTSVDHGTAYDVAGTGKADAAGMKSAIALGARLALKRKG